MSSLTAETAVWNQHSSEAKPHSVAVRVWGSWTILQSPQPHGHQLAGRQLLTLASAAGCVNKQRQLPGLVIPESTSSVSRRWNTTKRGEDRKMKARHRIMRWPWPVPAVQLAGR
ncbi:hypothetical protein JX265_013536 [Neoarthrinium moseri]|uniref:Uncharacterized protein n=1 Tax=Neoarthrinium moseri TaxID=1658444 RepID=A0A9Q0AHL4_9PEZI|nr:hypothetical protein JX265_013536 [Neoarthrinium moseri]